MATLLIIFENHLCWGHMSCDATGVYGSEILSCEYLLSTDTTAIFNFDFHFSPNCTHLPSFKSPSPVVAVLLCTHLPSFKSPSPVVAVLHAPAKFQVSISSGCSAARTCQVSSLHLQWLQCYCANNFFWLSGANRLTFFIFFSFSFFMFSFVCVQDWP